MGGRGAFLLGGTTGAVVEDEDEDEEGGGVGSEDRGCGRETEGIGGIEEEEG